MKFPSLNTMSPIEIIVSIVFFLYSILPIQTPMMCMSLVNTNIGLAIIMLLILYIVLSFHPILGVLSILAGFQLINRSTKLPVIMSSPSKTKKEQKKKPILENNFTGEVSLEEEMISQMAPVGQSPLHELVSSEFKPVNSKTTASQY